MSLDKATVAKIASLARIRMTEQELDSYSSELSSILNFVEQLSELDTTGVEPMTGAVSMTLKKRQDVVSDGGVRDDVLANAPEAASGFFVVPKVME